MLLVLQHQLSRNGIFRWRRKNIYTTVCPKWMTVNRCHTIIESPRLEKTTKIIYSNHQPITNMLTNHVPLSHVNLRHVPVSLTVATTP